MAAKAATWLTNKWQVWVSTALGRAVNRLVVIIAAAWLLEQVLRWLGGAVWGQRVPGLNISVPLAAYSLALLAASLLAWHLWEKRPWRLLGLQWDDFAWRDLLFGLGVVLFAALIIGIVLNLLPPLRKLLGWTPFLATLFAAAALAIAEEVFFRRYVLQNFREAGGIWWGLGVSALLFALYRGGPFNLFFINLLAGLVLGYTVISSRQLWVALGMQTAWYAIVRTITSGYVSGLLEFMVVLLAAVTVFTYLQVLTDRIGRIVQHE